MDGAVEALAHTGPGDDLEKLTCAYGRDLLARLERPGPLLFSPSWWDERLMELTMSDETVKVQLFRFIDVLPQLAGANDIVGHLCDYFAHSGSHAPRLIRLGLRMLPNDGLAGRLLATVARRSVTRLARRFIAGATLPEALSAVADLRCRRLAFTVDLLGEATVTEPEAETYQTAYLELLDGLSREVNALESIDLIDRDDHGPLPRVNVSVKLSSLFSQFDPIDPDGTSQAVRACLRPILRLAQHKHAFVNVDMEQYAYKDLTLRIFREILEEDEFRHWAHVGIAMQAYLRDTAADLVDLARFVERRGTPITVRLVKGAYWDYETLIAAQQGWTTPVFTYKWETDANYEQLTRYLLEHHHQLRPAFGSHNVRSLAHALALADLLCLPRTAYEFQLLYGMADPVKDALVALGRRVRVYTPYGKLLPGMAYLVRRLLENTANESFFARQHERTPARRDPTHETSPPCAERGTRFTKRATCWPCCPCSTFHVRE